jgi:hypothetical protein
MAFTQIGVDTITSISRQKILPDIVDVAYGQNALFYRLNQGNKKTYEGGTYLQQNFQTEKWNRAQWYQGFDELSIAPNDTIIAGGWEHKSLTVPVAIDGDSLTRANSSQAVLNLVDNMWDQAKQDMSDALGDGAYSDGTDPKSIEGLQVIVDDGTVATSYAGLLRATYPFLNAQVDGTTGTLTTGVLRSLVSDCSVGGHAPTLLLGRKEQYNRLYALYAADQVHNTGPSAVSDQPGTGGFTSLYFDHIPFMIDEKVPDGPNTSNSTIYCLNENYLKIWVANGIDFQMEDFIKPVNQNAMVGRLHWRGNIISTRPHLQGALTNISA